MTPTTAADKVKEIWLKCFDYYCTFGKTDEESFDAWLTTPEGSRLVWELGAVDKLQEAVNILQKMVTDTNPEQVMETYESIHVFLNSINHV